MARLQGISGGMSGRTGSFTYRQSRGETIVSQYQPIVKNPNTQSQQNQRARFKLMSQLAAIMAPGFGTMGVTKRPGKLRPTQRNAFMAINMPLVEVASSTDTATAKIPMQSLKLTSSFRALPPLELVNNAGDLEITIQSIAQDISAVRMVVVGYRQNVAAVQQIMDVPVSNGIATTELTGLSGEYTVLAYGLIPSESAKSSIDYDNIHTPADDDFVSAVQLDMMVSAGDMAETKTMGANITMASA